MLRNQILEGQVSINVGRSSLMQGAKAKRAVGNREIRKNRKIKQIRHKLVNLNESERLESIELKFVLIRLYIINT